MRPRIQSIDCLRVVAAWAVVWLHVGVQVVVDQPSVNSSDWWIGNFSDAYSRWCVPVFVMLSGSLLIAAKKATPESLEVFYRRRMAKLVVPIIFWTVFYLLLRYFTTPTWIWLDLLKTLRDGVPFYHLWYAYMVLGLYAFAPFLSMLALSLGRRSLMWLIFLCFFVASTEFMSASRQGSFVSSFLPYVGYFLAGYGVEKYLPQLRKTGLTVVFVLAGALLALGRGFLLPKYSGQSWGPMYDFLNPLVILMSLSFYARWAKSDLVNGPLGKLVARLAPLGFGVYLVHPFWIWLLDKVCINPFLVHPLVGIPLTTAVVFTLSLMTCWVFRRTPGLRLTL